MREFLATPEVCPDGAIVSRPPARLLAGAGAAVAVAIPVVPKAAFIRWVEQQNESRWISGTATDEEMEVACDLGFDIAQEMMRQPAETASD